MIDDKIPMVLNVIKSKMGLLGIILKSSKNAILNGISAVYIVCFIRFGLIVDWLFLN